MTDVQLVLTNKVATVTVTADLGVCDGDQPVPVRYIVTGSSGYRATLPACICEVRTPCPKAPDHSQDAEHRRTYCHGWHLPGRIERFANDVLKTYVVATPKVSSDGQLDLFATLEPAA